ncbi:2371_t:CDS:2 [Acaulospora morrowiae]|uniref:Guanine nucleotide-binding protein alpha-2 subunit n=1 Tax=Acaulospora morrowiae TaxID=94023 RepID=A0A9N9B266_9GLOM|nr:2371_t:CDS:2 [Acaulospora morrowiae]
MGNCVSSHDITTKRINKVLKEDEKRMRMEVKLLLLGKLLIFIVSHSLLERCERGLNFWGLEWVAISGSNIGWVRFNFDAGAGESGKSTVIKQMRLIHAAGFTSAERETYRSIVFMNIMHSMRLVLEAMEYFKIPFGMDGNMQYVSLFNDPPSISKGQPFPIMYLEPLKSLWVDSGVQKCYERGHQYALHDNMSYFFEMLDRVFSQAYVPSDQDILHTRMKTTGIVETVFHLGPLTYRMFDVGGQRSERKKWIHCFEDVTAVLFLVAISGYDQCLVEDKDSNQMQEALLLFDSICNSQWFVNTSMILFLNKIDIFRAKIKISPVRKYFPDYSGPNGDFKHTTHYFKRRFQRLNRSTTKEIYPHFTDATDTNLLRHIMSSVTDIILTQNLRDLVL